MTQEKWRTTPRTAPDVLWYEGYAITASGIHRVDISERDGDQIAMHWKSIDLFNAQICPQQIKEAGWENVDEFIALEVVNMKVHGIYYWRFSKSLDDPFAPPGRRLQTPIGYRLCKMHLAEPMKFKPNFESSKEFENLRGMVKAITSFDAIIPGECEIPTPYITKNL